MMNEIYVISASSQSSWNSNDFSSPLMWLVERTQTLTLYSDIFVAQKGRRNTENLLTKLCFEVETNALCRTSLDL